MAPLKIVKKFFDKYCKQKKDVQRCTFLYDRYIIDV